MKRGERLEDLMNKTDEMANEADQFRRGATKLKNAMWWKNVRLMIILAVVVIVSLIFRKGRFKFYFSDRNLTRDPNSFWERFIN